MMPPDVSEGSGVESVGARLKRLRLQRGFSQRDLSSPGVSYAYISRIEAGARTPSVKALRKLSQKLGVSVEYLETGQGHPRRRRSRAASSPTPSSSSGSPRQPGAAEQKLRDAPRRGDARRRRTPPLRRARDRASVLLQRSAATISTPSSSSKRRCTGPPRLAAHAADVYATLGQSYAALGAPDRAVRLLRLPAGARRDRARRHRRDVRYATLPQLCAERRR